MSDFLRPHWIARRKGGIRDSFFGAGGGRRIELKEKLMRNFGHLFFLDSDGDFPLIPTCSIRECVTPQLFLLSQILLASVTHHLIHCTHASPRGGFLWHFYFFVRGTTMCSSPPALGSKLIRNEMLPRLCPLPCNSLFHFVISLLLLPTIRFLIFSKCPLHAFCPRKKHFTDKDFSFLILAPYIYFRLL